jgi:hypothetical protein
MINKRFVKHWKKIPVKAIKWSTKAGSLKPNEAVTLNLHFQHSMNAGKYPVMHMMMGHTMNHVTMK